MRTLRGAAVAVLSVGLVLAAAGQSWAAGTFLKQRMVVSTLASTVPPSGLGAGDVNPYGVAVVPRNIGRLHAGWVLVSNFNDKANLQGTGTTIVQVSPTGSVQIFARIDPAHLPGLCPGGVGLTTALTVFRSGWVVVGSLPTRDGTAATAKAGCLLLLDRNGLVRRTITSPLVNGPWDLAAVDHGSTADVYVTNVLNGTVAARGAVIREGTVVRIRLHVSADRPPTWDRPVVIGSGFAERTDPAALVVGPTGLTLDHATLYVADTNDNRITGIDRPSSRMTSAGTGHVVTSGGALKSPLGLATAPNADLLSVNAGDGLIVETTPAGRQVATHVIDTSGTPPGAGALFGLAPRPDGKAVYLVDDATNTLDLLH